MMSWSSFSQIDINSQIQLTKPIAKLVIKDLIQYDGLSEEMITLKSIIDETNIRLNIQTELVSNLNSQLTNYQNIIAKKDEQFTTQKELADRLQQDLKKQRLKTKLMGGAGLLLAVAVASILN
jgi:uncharacterized coiled-coil protein SlyX